MEQELLKISNLVTAFENKRRTIPVLHGVDLSIKQGEILGIVGESGSGKTLTALSIMQLLPHGSRIKSGSICFNGTEITQLNEKQMCSVRGKCISMIFQDPMVALDPVYKCGDQISEAMRLHMGCSKNEAREKGLELLEQMRIPNPEKYYDAYPHELSGGMCQRIMIAIALSCAPQLLIADEPTTALDVTVQAKILQLLKDIQRERNTGIMIITHDLGVIAEIADNVAVMYMGEIVESGTRYDLFENSSHPYTKGLLKSIPRLDQEVNRLYSIVGNVPAIGAHIEGCRFCERCPQAMKVCHRKSPPVSNLGNNHNVRCWLYAQKEEAHDA